MRVFVTDHCAERYVARVDPSMTVEQARRHLGEVLRGARAHPHVSWLSQPWHRTWLVEVEAGVCIPLRSDRGRLVAATVLTRDGER